MIQSNTQKIEMIHEYLKNESLMHYNYTKYKLIMKLAELKGIVNTPLQYEPETKPLKECNSEEALLMKARHILKMQKELINELREGADEEFLEEIQADEVEVQVDAFLEDHQLPKFT